MSALAKPRLVTCPQCKGNTKITVEVKEFGKPPITAKLKCVTCDGFGTVTARQARAEEEFWCRCGDAGDNVRYYADGERADCTKHHWRHEPGCGRVVQVG